MNDSEFREKFWSKLVPFVGDLISNAPRFPNNYKYVEDCWEKLRIELNDYELSETDFNDIYAKFRKQIEDEILKVGLRK